MNLDQIKHEMIKSAEAKLNAHNRMGSSSKLSILEVAQLRDIVAGNIEETDFRQGQFFGLHSLN
jgi:hypothetical protein